jgi:IS5 family transposase
MSEPAIRYKIENWSEYNQSLIRRGDITLWFDQEVLSQWQATERTGKRGRPIVYSAVVLRCMLALRLLYCLPLRAAQGLFCSLLCLLGLALPVPNYTTLCRRQGTLHVDLGVSSAEEPRHILVDSTGLKVFGEGEWKVRQHGVGKRRTWRKLHLAIDAKSREIVAAALTDSGTQDCEVLPSLLLQIDGFMAKVGADGAYDSWECRYAIIQHHAQAVIPPRENAVINGNDQIEEVRQRDEALRQIEREGLKAWKQDSGYHQRSLAETAMFRVKTTFGTEMKARVIQNQITEALMKSHILNRFIQQGLPASVQIEA